MPKLLSIENFRGMVADAPDGKQPEGTCKTITNLVYDREVGSLVTRYTYENSLARPSGVATLNHWLTFPTTYPSAQDNHIWFTEDGIFIRPYFHASGSATDDWKLITEQKLFDTVASGQATVNASPTNTLVITSADADGFSQTADYYKNWILYNTQNADIFFVRGYSYAAASSGTATFTLDTVVGLATGEVPDLCLLRYFHSDTSFTPAFSTPAGYATEIAYRFSGGRSSTVGNKNIWAGYLDKTFFNDYQFQGTYLDQAECKAPASGLLQSMTEANAISTLVITNTNDYQFLSPTTTNWAAGGNHSRQLASLQGTDVRGMNIFATGDGDNATNRVTLASVTLSTGVSYTLRLNIAELPQGANLIVDWNGTTIGTIAYGSGYEGQDRVLDDPFDFTFTVAGTATANLSLYFDAPPAAPVFIKWINIYATSITNFGVMAGKTYSFYATYMYDGSQESELTYLGRKYISNSNAKITNILQLRLSSLNKRISSVRLYVAIDDGDTTKGSNTTRISPAFFFRDVLVTGSTYTWTLDATNGYYEYTDNFLGYDQENLKFTWEQKTRRTASTSTTCSYSLACMASGRVFVSNDYDYADAAGYYNRIRHTGFNGDGAPTPDIFPNIPEIAIKTITAGQSQEIKNIVEYAGDVIVLKKSSALRLKSSNPNSDAWELTLIKNGIGTRSKRAAYKFDKGLFFADVYSCYLYDGYRITDVLKGRWRNLYQTLVTAATAESIIVWYNPINDSIALTTGNVQGLSQVYYEFNTNSWLPVKMDNGAASTYRIGSVVTTSDGVIHFAPQTVGANALKISQTAGSVLVDVSIDTGYYDVPAGKTGRAKWVNVLAESGNASPFTVVLLGDGSTLQTGVFTPSATTKKLYKFQTTTDVPCKMFKVTLSQTGTVAPSTKEFKLHKIWVDGDIVDEQTDVIETVAVT